MDTPPTAGYAGAAPAGERPVSLPALREMKARGEKIAMLTAYDATFARVAAESGVDCLLVGDSLGMVLKGDESTLAVTVGETAYHTACVVRGVARARRRPLVIADMPFGSYQASKEDALRYACTLMQAGAQMVKLEGGGWVEEAVAFLVARGIPVCAHLGLTPQSVHALGGWRVQGRNASEAQVLAEQALRLEAAGAALLVLEMVPAALAAQVSASLAACASIGIGAGAGTDGQVLVLHDMLGLAPESGRVPRFVVNFLRDTNDIGRAIGAYVAAVKAKTFPVDALHAW